MFLLFVEEISPISSVEKKYTIDFVREEHQAEEGKENGSKSYNLEWLEEDEEQGREKR